MLQEMQEMHLVEFDLAQYLCPGIQTPEIKDFPPLLCRHEHPSTNGMGLVSGAHSAHCTVTCIAHTRDASRMPHATSQIWP